MKRAIIGLPDDVAVVLVREARRQGASVSEITRRALLAYLQIAIDRPRELHFANLGRSEYRHTARDLEEILADEWARDRDR